MRRRGGWLLIGLLAVLATACSRGESVSFNLSTSKTFAPGEQPKIHLYTHNVDALEFRVYRVNEPVKFIENLRELHSFGPEQSLTGPERIDERSWLERFHDWKADVREEIRDFFRGQLSMDARHEMRQKQSAIRRKSRIVGEAEFAQIPILNQSQLVARWRQLVPPTFVSDQNVLAVPKLSAGLYLLEATDGRYKAYTLLMVSEMALVTRTTPGSVIAYAVDRVTGQPIAGVRVDAGLRQNVLVTATTNASGIAELAIPSGKASQDNFWMVASKGDEFAVSTPGSWMLNMTSAGKYTGYIFTERPVYRPTHTVHWRAILRESRDNALVVPKSTASHVTITDQADKLVFEKQMPLSATGEVSGDFDLPKDAALGYYTLRAGDGQNAIACGFHVEDYRKPEYQVRVTPAKKRVLEGETMPVTIDSRYFFGEPVPNAKVKYRVYHERHYWWGEAEDDTADQPSDTDQSDFSAGDEEAEKTGRLDDNGKLTIQVPTKVDTQGDSHPDFDYTVEAGVTDAANREITGRGRFLATYGTFRLNVEPVDYAIHANEAAKFHVTAVDYDSKPISTKVHVQLVFRHYKDGKTERIDGPATDVTTDAAGNAAGQVQVGAAQYSGAELLATASAVQAGTRDPVDESFLWIMGAGEMGWDNSMQTTQIVADKKSYAPGDTAHLSIVSEIDGFHALVIVQGQTIQSREVMHTDGKTLSFDLPITAESQPNITVDALFIRNNTLYQATKILKVPPVKQQLQVTITPTKEIFQPQQNATYTVETRDYAGKPVSAELSFGVVDEAIYSLYPDVSGDMVGQLYPQRRVESEVDSSLDYYFSGEAGTKSPMLAMRNARYRPQLAQVKPGNEAKPRVRKAFPDTAFWAPHVKTDANGHAQVALTFPDSLTTWRATVHAITAQSQAGSAISRVLVRKNVLVRMGTPRFMIKGDEVTLPVIVHNYLETAKQARVSLKIEGLDTVGGSEQTVTISSKGEATLAWRLRASQVGAAKLTATAITDEESDALEINFPVEPAGVAKIVAKSGVVAQADSQATTEIVLPANTDAAAYSMRVEVSPSIAGSLFSALDYLTTFPYGCTEQTMSSYLPNVIVAETLNRLNVGGRIDQADLRAKMQAGLERLKDYQHEDGGWGWWKEDESRVSMTAYVVSGIGQGAQFVPLTWPQKTMLSNGSNYLHSQLQQHPKMRPELRAAVLYALAISGDPQFDRAQLDTEYARRKDLDPEALAMVGLAMLQVHDTRAEEVAQLLESRAQHEGDLLSWKSSYVPVLDTEYSNNAEATAYAVRLLAKINPQNPLLAGAAQWLMLSRDDGAWWGSTEQTAMVLFGLVDYLAASHELEADFTVDVLVNGRSVGQRHFSSADAVSGASLSVDVGAAQLHAGANRVEVVRRGGSGRIYWSARGRFYSTEKKDFQAGTMSLNLTRDYYKLQAVQKDGRIVYSLQPLIGTAQVGDVLAVHEAINGTPMKYLLLEDPIPAGAEFVTNESSYEIDHRPGGWTDWFTRREFHDDHAAFFASEFNGRQEVFYLIRVVGAGAFQISPARVEAMYQHGVQATSDALRLDVPAPSGGPQ